MCKRIQWSYGRDRSKRSKIATVFGGNEKMHEMVSEDVPTITISAHNALIIHSVSK